jgi:Na+/proline symporter
MEVINHAAEHGKFDFWPTMSPEAILAFIATFITMALGSIPQQDVFQRVMSSKDEKTAAWGSIIGGSFYILFCFVPMFITYAVVMLDPGLMELHSGPDGDYQRILPEYILNEVPMFVQILFFGALLSAIMSTASATLLALSATMSENILKEALHLKEKAFLITLRVCVLAFGMIVFAYGYASVSAGLSIFEMVENAYLVTLCGAFVPLAFGVYWKGATKSGALTSIFLGVGTWITLEVLTYGLPNRETAFLMPPQLAGLLMAILGMFIGSKLPLMNKHHHAHTQSAA